MFGFDDMLIGAGIGALGSSLFGGNPIKGGILGGVTGGLLGGSPAGAWTGGAAKASSTSPFSIGSLFNGIGTNAAAGGDVAKGLTMNASMLSPSLASESMPLAFTQGAENAFSAASPYSLGYTSSGVSPFTPAAESMAIPSAADIGAGFGTADLSNMAVNDPTLWERIKPYATIQNLSGAANIYDKFAPKYQPAQISGGGGGIQRGQAPQGTDVTALIQSQKPYQRKKISLL